MTEAMGSRYVSQATLTLPLGPSWNSKRRAYLRQKVRDTARRATAGIRLDPGYMYWLNMMFYDKWYKSDGTPYRRDLSNLIKVVEDEVFRALELDDKHVSCLRAVKAVPNPGHGLQAGTVWVRILQNRKL